MGDVYQVRVESVDGRCLTCRVAAFCDHDGHKLIPSRTLALGFLWDTTDWFWWMQNQPGGRALERMEADAAAESTPLGQALAGDFYGNTDWFRDNVEQFISCVGVVNRSEYQPTDDDETRFEAEPQATYHIAVTDTRWLEHLAPGMEWGSRVSNGGWHLACDPAWRTSDVLALAHGINDDLAFDRLPILADALQEAGCEDEAILGHCRGPGPHVRGCWVLDLLLRRFEPAQLDAAKVYDTIVTPEPSGEGQFQRGARFDDRADIDEVVAVVRSGQLTADQEGESCGAIWFNTWGEEHAVLRYLPGNDPGWYVLRCEGRAYRVPRAAFVAALRRVGVEVPVG